MNQFLPITFRTMWHPEIHSSVDTRFSHGQYEVNGYFNAVRFLQTKGQQDTQLLTLFITVTY